MRGPFGEGAVPFMRRQLQDWLDLSLHRGLPSSLLLLSRAFTITANVRDVAQKKWVRGSVYGDGVRNGEQRGGRALWLDMRGTEVGEGEGRKGVEWEMWDLTEGGEGGAVRRGAQD